MINIWLLLLLVVTFHPTSSLLHHRIEANHSLEECICCSQQKESLLTSLIMNSNGNCLTNVGPSKHFIGLTNKTFQHLLFETITKEIENEILLIQGQFPAWCSGSLLKNGFGQYESKKSHYEFLTVFDAMGYAAKITILPNGSATVTAKLTKNDWFNRSEGLNGYSPHIPPYRSFMGTEPPLSFAQRIRLLFTIVPDNLNVNIVRQGKRLFGISDMDGFNSLDPETLNFLEYFRYSDSLSMTSSIFALLGVMTSAHPVFRVEEPHLVYNFVAVPGGYLLSASFFHILMTVATLWISYGMVKSASGPKVAKSYLKVCIFLVVVSAVRWSFAAIDGQIDGVYVNKYVLYRLDTSKEPLSREVVIEFPNRRLSYLHEMAITSNYIVLAEWPVFWNIGSIINPFFNDPAKLTLTWDPKYETRITVVNTITGKIESEHFDLGPYWSYHHIGAYEDGQGNIIMDACTFDSGEHLHTFETRTLKRNTYAIPRNVNRRFIIPIKSGNQKTITVQNVGPVGFDLPTRNQETVSRKYKYAYGTGHRTEGEWWNSIVKVDMDTGKTIQWYEEHTWPSQPVFMPHPERKSEDHGMLLTLMMDGKTKRSFLLALNAETMVEEARAWIPIILPYTSHGYFDVEWGGDANSTVIPGVKNGFKVAAA
jgi:carotenoid cleavage dioxygenase-like enzyme